jgi:hypothetical protein
MWFNRSFSTIHQSTEKAAVGISGSMNRICFDEISLIERGGCGGWSGEK